MTFEEYEAALEEWELDIQSYQERVAEAGMSYACEGFSGSEATDMGKRWIGPPPQKPEAPEGYHEANATNWREPWVDIPF